MSKKLAALESRYRKKLAQLSGVGYLSKGSLYARPKGKPGSRYLWTWKNREQKTESLSLSKEQYQWLQKAIRNQRKAEELLSQLHELSRQIVVQTLPSAGKRK
jgi:hypothetical protein